MNILRCLKDSSTRRGLLSVLAVTSAFVLAAAAPQSHAAESSANAANSGGDLQRSFAWMVKTPDATVEDIRHWYEDLEGGDKFSNRFNKLTKRYSRNFVVGIVPGSNIPDFSLIKEFGHVKGARETIQGEIPRENATTIERVTYQDFLQRLIAGSALVSEPGPVRKRGIFLRRVEKASPETVASELSGFAETVTAQLGGISRRVMLYTMTGVPRNYPIVNYPSNEVQPRHFDAILMVWPEQGRLIPSTFGPPPSNYRVLYSVDFDSYDSPAT